MKLKAPAGIFLLVIALAFPVLAHEEAPAATGFQSNAVAQLDDAEKKLVALAEAVPAEKWSWRPGDGVRSFGEVIAHVSGGNYLLGEMVGAKRPEGIDPMAMDKITDKAEAIAALKKSFEFSRGAAKGLADKDIPAAAKFFGRDSTRGAILFTATTHAHEHLGQAIAYARMMGVKPPWSR